MTENKITIIQNEIEIFDEQSENEIMIFEEKKKVKEAIIFTPQGMNKVLELIEKKARTKINENSFDITTKEGQKEIKSIASDIAKCKSPLEAVAKSLKEDHYKTIEAINSERDRAFSVLDNLRDEIRKPVTEIEQKQEAEKKVRQDRLNDLEYYKNANSCSTGIDDKIVFYNSCMSEVEKVFEFEWADFEFRAKTIFEEAKLILNLKIADLERQKKQEEELAQLKKEKAEREQKDRENKIAREAAEKAKREAEELAEKERKAALEREAKIEADKKAAEQAQVNAEIRAKEAERLAIEQAAQAEERRIAAEKKAKEDSEKAAVEAVKREQSRVAEEKRLADLAAEKAAANKKHRAKINNQAVSDLVCHVMNDKGVSILDEETSKRIVEVIARGLIGNVSINY